MLKKMLRKLLKRDTYNYRLNIGPVVVYIGISKYPKMKEAVFQYHGVGFTHMTVDEEPQTYENAKREAEKRLADYKKENGKLPLYNATPDTSVENLYLPSEYLHPRYLRARGI
ncbi:MAG: hypothetical protein GDA50_06010 [Alphaproteobacteria bacterium GM202ARS2]|nr:hypothetical protein [Alphaproteobacteria bacterium GM202ARS2]